MDFRTPIELPRPSFTLQPSDSIVLLGSCFAAHIGERLARALPAERVCLNPTGVLYNPLSITRTISMLLKEGKSIEEYLFQGRDGLWRNWLFSGIAATENPDDCLRLTREALQRGAQMLRQAKLCVVTWGTNVYYRLKDTPVIVANCHKEPAECFTEGHDSIDNIVLMWHPFIETVRRLNPSLHWVFTVSPYRYAKYGFHRSNLSKAVLLLAAERVCAAHDNCHYFPAYEILLDELRDYRFYEPDMLHPSGQAVDYIWERFKDWCFSDRLREFAADHEKLVRARSHRPLHPGTAACQQFLKNLEAQEAGFRRKWADELP